MSEATGTYQETTYCPYCEQEAIVPAEHGDGPIICPTCGCEVLQELLVAGWTHE